MLDIHEKAHGPHGLIAGMTGSGKSEWIMSYILSLAICYNPEDLAFILIDYKGGGMAQAFAKLPHTAGIITNLDGNMIRRSLMSIDSELKRRQRIFSLVSSQIGTSTIDIYKYQQLYHQGEVKESIPHLLIIADEFAELKDQEPEFMDDLISAARIGRSLGVHLILATQKPSGVVNDQIWSNTRFRICLKVQDRSDSQEMLRRPEAAELKQVGRFYMQVGYNELFELGQAAWAGGKYIPQEQIVRDDESMVLVHNEMQHTILEVNADNSAVEMLSHSKPEKQIDVLIRYIIETGEKAELSVRSLWLDPLPEKILYDDVRKSAQDLLRDRQAAALVAMIDDPANQRQHPLVLNLEDGHTVVYGMAGSGKGMFLQTALYSYVQEKSVADVNVYILDFASETFGVFSQAPIVGDVIRRYETEKVARLFHYLLNELEQRRRQFSEFGGSLLAYNSQSDVKMPAIVVMLDGMATFREEFEAHEDSLVKLMREGLNYGFYFLVTATGSNDIRYRLQQLFVQPFTMQLTDSMDYTTHLGQTDGLQPGKAAGSGLFREDRNVLAFQTLSIAESEHVADTIRHVCRNASAQSGDKAPFIRIMPESLTPADLARYFTKIPAAFPLGLEQESIDAEYLDFSKRNIWYIFSQSDRAIQLADSLAAIADVLGQPVACLNGQTSLSADITATLKKINHSNAAQHGNKAETNRIMTNIRLLHQAAKQLTTPSLNAPADHQQYERPAE